MKKLSIVLCVMAFLLTPLFGAEKKRSSVKKIVTKEHQLSKADIKKLVAKFSSKKMSAKDMKKMKAAFAFEPSGIAFVYRGNGRCRYCYEDDDDYL